MTLDTIGSILAEVDGWLDEGEARLLNKRASEVVPPWCVVEIGSWKGRSTCIMGHSLHPGVEMFAIDPLKSGIVQLASNLQRFVPSSNLTFINQPSLFVAMNWPNRPIGLIFFDGDHEAILADIAAWLPYVVVGGLCAFHDIDHETTRWTVEHCTKLEALEQVDRTRICRKVTA